MQCGEDNEKKKKQTPSFEPLLIPPPKSGIFGHKILVNDLCMF